MTKKELLKKIENGEKVELYHGSKGGLTEILSLEADQSAIMEKVSTW